MSLEKRLVVGAKIRLGEEYCRQTRGFTAGQVITLIEGHFEYDNGLYSTSQTAPSIWCEKQKDFDSIYHLFGNDLEDFMDCEIIDKVKEHILKIAPEYFEAVENGSKTFEIRVNDRDFKQGDWVILKEYIKERDEYTGDSLTRKIGFVTDFAQIDNYVVFSLLT